MREQRRHLPCLETLDERIVPSAIGLAASKTAAMTEHPSTRGEVQAASVKHAHVLTHTLKHTHIHTNVRHSRIVLAPQVATGSTVANAAVVTGQASGSTSAGTSTSVSPSISPSQAVTAGTIATSPVSTSSASTTVSSVPTSSAPTGSVSTKAGTTSDIDDIKNGPLAKAGPDLIAIYQAFQKNGSGATTTTSNAPGQVKVRGTNVGVDVHSAGGNFSTLVSALSGMGMQVQTQDPTHGIVEGMLPIAQLPSAAGNSQTLSLTPIYVPRPATTA